MHLCDVNKHKHLSTCLSIYGFINIILYVVRNDCLWWQSSTWLGCQIAKGWRMISFIIIKFGLTCLQVCRWKVKLWPHFVLLEYSQWEDELDWWWLWETVRACEPIASYPGRSLTAWVRDWHTYCTRVSGCVQHSERQLELKYLCMYTCTCIYKL